MFKLHNLPNYLIVTTAIFALSIIGVLFSFFWGAFKTGLVLDIPITVADSATYHQGYTPDMNSRYEVSLTVSMPIAPATVWNPNDTTNKVLEQVQLRTQIRCGDSSVAPISASQGTYVSSYSLRDSGLIQLKLSNYERFRLNKSKFYDCTISYSNVPREFLGLPGRLRLHTVPHDGGRASQWFYRLVVIGALSALCGLIFATSYVIWRLQRKQIVDEQIGDKR